MKIFNRNLHILLLLVISVTVVPALARAQIFDEVVIKRGVVDDDIYMAGAQVDLYATVKGDVVVAGGQLNLEGVIEEDLLAAGGSIELRSDVGDDVRIAGGEIRVAGRIGDDLVAAGGRIHVTPSASIGGRAWIAGGDIRLDGEVLQELRASAGRVVITGRVNGNVELVAEQVSIEETAVINGNLHYRSPVPARIASGARISGKVSHTRVEVDMRPLMAGVVVASLLFLISIIFTAVVIYLLFPDYCQRLDESLRNKPWMSLGIGLAVFAGVPVLILILLSTAVGIWLALMLLALYLVMLLAGYIIGAMFLGNAGLDRMRKSESGKALRALALAVAIIVLALFNLVPVLGTLLNWAVLLAGIGALSRQLYLSYQQ
jgi:cytoskeletal protein CcmA (bactofilin family)